GDQRRLRRLWLLSEGGGAARVLALDGFEIVDHEQRRRAVLAQPSIGRMAHNGEEPGTRVDPGKTADISEGAQARLLHHVLRVGPISGEPARERVGVGEMRQHHAGEARLIVLAAQASHPRCAPLRSYRSRSAGARIYSRDRAVLAPSAPG